METADNLMALLQTVSQMYRISGHVGERKLNSPPGVLATKLDYLHTEVGSIDVTLSFGDKTKDFLAII